MSFIRNIATFETGMTGNNMGGVIYIVQDNHVSFMMNAMTGDISASRSSSGVAASLGHGKGILCDVFLVKSMKENITAGGSDARNGGIFGAIVLGYFLIEWHAASLVNVLVSKRFLLGVGKEYR